MMNRKIDTVSDFYTKIVSVWNTKKKIIIIIDWFLSLVFFLNSLKKILLRPILNPNIVNASTNLCICWLFLQLFEWCNVFLFFHIANIILSQLMQLGVSNFSKCFSIVAIVCIWITETISFNKKRKEMS